MKIKIIYKFCFFLYLFHFSVLALPISPDGIGAIVEEKLRTEGYYFPNREIPLYAITDEGKFVHDFEYSIVYAKENFEDIQKGELCIQESGQKYLKIKFSDFISLNYEGRYFIVYEQKKGFVRILRDTVRNMTDKNPKDLSLGFFVKLSDLKKANFYSETWIGIIQKKETLYNSVKIGLNLRKSPDSKSEKLTKILKTNYEIIPSRETKGQWLKVKVLLHRGEFCEAGDDVIEKEWEGWIKAIDDSGKPNVWFFASGC